MRRTLLRLVVLGAVGAWISGAAFGSVITMNMNTTLSGSPPGSGPWLTATFTDVAANEVRLTLTPQSSVGASDDVADVYLNYSGTPALSSLVFSAPTVVGAVSNVTINKAAHSYHAVGDGYYDIEIGFAGVGTGQFQYGDSISWDITATGLDAADFDYQSSNSTGTLRNGGYYAAAQLACDEASYVGAPDATSSVPEPATFIVWSLLGSAGWMGMRVWRRRGSSFDPGGAACRQPWSPENRQAIHGIIARASH